MNLGFLSNPPSMIIAAVSVLGALFMVLHFLGKHHLTLSKDGISISDAETERSMAEKIPAIDQEIKASCREELSESKEMILGQLHICNKSHALIIANKFDHTLRHRIIENDLCEKFTDKGRLNHWIDRCTREAMDMIAYASAYTGEEYEVEKIEPVIQELCWRMYKKFYDYVVKGVKQKIGYYGRLKSTDKIKELLARNHSYLEHLKEIRYA